MASHATLNISTKTHTLSYTHTHSMHKCIEYIYIYSFESVDLTRIRSDPHSQACIDFMATCKSIRVRLWSCVQIIVDRNQTQWPSAKFSGQSNILIVSIVLTGHHNRHKQNYDIVQCVRCVSGSHRCEQLVSCPPLSLSQWNSIIWI